MPTDKTRPAPTHGGKRAGAGRKARETTRTTGFRINSEALAACRRLYGRSLNARVNDFIKSLALGEPVAQELS